MGEPQRPKTTTTDPRASGRPVPDHVSGPEDCVEEAGEESFPASDPPSYTPVTHTGKPKPEPVPQKKH